MAIIERIASPSRDQKFDACSRELILTSDYETILTLLRTRKDIASLRKEDHLWEQLIIRDFGVEALPPKKSLCYTAFRLHHYLAKKIPKTEMGSRLPIPFDLLELFHFRQVINQELDNRLLEQRPYRISITTLIFSSYLKDFLKRDQAKTWAMSLPDSAIKGIILSNIAFSYRDHGDPDEERLILFEAERTLDSLSDDDYKKPLCLYALARWPSSYDDAARRRVLTKAKNSALKLSENRKKQQILEEIGLAFLDFRQDTDGVENEVENVAEHLLDEDLKTNLLKGTVAFFLRRGEYLQAKSFIMRQDKKLRNFLFYRMGCDLCQFCRYDVAERIALMIDNAEMRSDLLSLIVKRLVEQNYQEAKRIVQLIPDEQRRDALSYQIVSLSPSCKERFISRIKSIDVSSLGRRLFVAAIIGFSLYNLYQGFFREEE
jgi:hypothetical protein